MKHIISMPLETGGTIELEVDDTSVAPVTRGGVPQALIERAAGSFEAAVARVKPVAVAVVKQFAEAVHGTTSVKVTFGLKFNAEAGAIIASVGSEANFKIEVNWAHSGRE